MEPAACPEARHPRSSSIGLERPAWQIRHAAASRTRLHGLSGREPLTQLTRETSVVTGQCVRSVRQRLGHLDDLSFAAGSERRQAGRLRLGGITGDLVDELPTVSRVLRHFLAVTDEGTEQRHPLSQVRVQGLPRLRQDPRRRLPVVGDDDAQVVDARIDLTSPLYPWPDFEEAIAGPLVVLVGTRTHRAAASAQS